MNVCPSFKALLMLDLRPLLTCNETVVMLAAAKVVGNMISIAGATLGESFFVKEIGQAIQLLEGKS
jgi:FKBP12-rapamycin complex-associated protein